MSHCSKCNDDGDGDGEDNIDATTIRTDDGNDSESRDMDFDDSGDSGDDSRLEDHNVRRVNDSSINQIVDLHALHRRIELLQWLFTIGHGLDDAPIHLSSLLCKSSFASIHYAKSSKAATICADRHKSSSHSHNDDDDADDNIDVDVDDADDNIDGDEDLLSIVPCIAGVVRLYGVLQSLMKMHPLFDNGNDIFSDYHHHVYNYDYHHHVSMFMTIIITCVYVYNYHHDGDCHYIMTLYINTTIIAN